MRAIYKSDGASRGQGAEGAGCAGWGAAFWEETEDGYADGPPQAAAYGHLGDAVSNNVAEYTGLQECLRKAARCLHPHVVFQVDSKLVAEQMARHGAWACRSPDLIPLRDACRDFGQVLTDALVIWEVRHIYRESNQTADASANDGVDCSNTSVGTTTW